MAMTVVYEGAIFQSMPCGGVARYFCELIDRLPADIHRAMVGPRESSVDSLPGCGDFFGVPTRPFLKPLRGLLRQRMQRNAQSKFDSVSAAVEHWTYYHGLNRRPIQSSGRPLVVTVYDFIHEAFPELDQGGNHIEIKHHAIRIADHICCISQATHDELCERFPSAAHKASVTSLGTSLVDVKPAPLPESLNDAAYILFVGRRSHYKNFSVVWEAWKSLRGRCPNGSKLVVVGPAMKPREAKSLGWSTEDPSVCLLPNASDALLRSLYQHSSAFIFPSKAEGFGLPSLEAMAAGAPVLVSDLPVMREVVGECGYYFDPTSKDDVADRMLAALKGDLPGRDDVIQAARQRVSLFDWKATADATATLYRQLAESCPTQDTNSFRAA